MTLFETREQPAPLLRPRCENLVCIYTCERHRPLLDDFYHSVVGQFLLTWPGSEIFEVYADPDIGGTFHSGSSIIVRSPERYDALTLKTYEMLRYCASAFRFRRLLKIDVTTVQQHFEAPEYAGRTPIDLTKLVRFLADSPPDSDYDGFSLRARVLRKQAEKWASKKGLVVDYERLFGNDPIVPFFHGKAYFLSHAFAGFISRNGAEIAREHTEFFPAAEDVMVGRLFKEYELHRHGHRNGS